jgi:hypothetical protein
MRSSLFPSSSPCFFISSVLSRISSRRSWASVIAAPKIPNANFLVIWGCFTKRKKSTDGYYDLLVEDKWELYLYEYHGGKYENRICYGRSNGLGSPARPTPCPAGIEPDTTSDDAVPAPN